MREITISKVEEILMLSPDEFKRFIPDLVLWYESTQQLYSAGILLSADIEWTDDGENRLTEIYLTFDKPPCCRECASPFQKMSVMIACPMCHNKRCPKASNHINECAGSNEPNQEQVK